MRKKYLQGDGGALLVLDLFQGALLMADGKEDLHVTGANADMGQDIRGVGGEHSHRPLWHLLLPGHALCHQHGWLIIHLHHAPWSYLPPTIQGKIAAGLKSELHILGCRISCHIAPERPCSKATRTGGSCQMMACWASSVWKAKAAGPSLCCSF